METISVDTGERCELIDITEKVREVVKRRGWKEGILVLNSLHTTGGLTVNESYDPDVQTDLIEALEEIVPKLSYRHMEGNSDSHIKTSLVGTDLSLIIEKGNLILGRWQGVYFCEFDGPRSGRRIAMKFIGS